MHISKPWNQLSESEVINIHLYSEISTTTDYIILSTLRRIEREARHAIANEYSKSFLPLMACYAILDQVGKCYKNKQKSPYTHQNANGIKKAAYYFLGYEENGDLTKTLYGLRNGIVHDASYVSHAKDGSHYWYRWDDEQTEIIRTPSMPWDGTLGSRSDSNCSFVNPKVFMDSVSEMLNRMMDLNKSGYLSLSMDGGVDELALRYLHLKPHT